MRRALGTLLASGITTVAFAAPAQAADPTRVFKATGAPIDCVAANGVRECGVGARALQRSFDQAPIDVQVILPATGDGPFPLVGLFHGWGGTKADLTSRMRELARRGYATFSMSDRGWGESCGARAAARTEAATAADCLEVGYNHLLDSRYEVRDAQLMMGRLVDDGVAKPDKLGATGGSYGGGMSMALAALKDRTMSESGALVPWRSPAGVPMKLAAAAPEIPWTDLANSLLPNGHQLDYAISGDGYGPRAGVMKASYVSGLFGTGLASSNYAAPGQDSGADLFTWFLGAAAGDPYDQNPLTGSFLTELQKHHSSYYIDPSEAPAPLFISNGFTDDLFPVDEALRFYNRTKALWPDAYVGLYDLDYGHARGQNKDADIAQLRARQDAFLDRFLQGKGTGFDAADPENVTVRLQDCSSTDKDTAPASKAYSARSWAELVPGEVRLDSRAEQVVATPSDPQSGVAFDPIASGPAMQGGACAQPADVGVSGTGKWALPMVQSDGGYTLIGGATIIATVRSTSPTNQLVARLVDVAQAAPGQPFGTKTLVARGTFRPALSATGEEQVFQLHPGAWKFAKGHVPVLELMTADAPYARPSNGQTPMVVSRLQLRLPVAEKPDGQVVLEPAPKYVPAGFTLAPDWGGPVVRTPKDGVDGKDGAPGQDGADGKDGKDGAPGQNGKDGAQGPAGQNGKDGAQGPAGQDGKDGAQGPQGPAGQDGQDGAQGPQGPQGPAGQDGQDGAQGPAGPAGPRGPQGKAGKDGRDGQDAAGAKKAKTKTTKASSSSAKARQRALAKKRALARKRAAAKRAAAKRAAARARR